MKPSFPTPPEMLEVKSRDKYPWRSMKVGESFEILNADMKFKYALNYSYRMGKRLNRRFKVKDFPNHNCCLVALIEDKNIIEKSGKPIDTTISWVKKD